MATLFTGLAGLIGGGAAAGAGTGIITTLGTTGAAAAGSGISLASILQGVATVAGVVASIGAGAAEAERQELAADDAEREVALETLQGVQRRGSIKRQLVEAVGAQDTAYAASGVDLSFGTARQARQDSYREADLGLTSDAGTEMTRSSRLVERAANYRRAAKQSRILGLFNGLSQGASGFAKIAMRGG